jgi:hypothetical protein
MEWRKQKNKNNNYIRNIYHIAFSDIGGYWKCIEGVSGEYFEPDQ